MGEIFGVCMNAALYSGGSSLRGCILLAAPILSVPAAFARVLSARTGLPFFSVRYALEALSREEVALVITFLGDIVGVIHSTNGGCQMLVREPINQTLGSKESDAQQNNRMRTQIVLTSVSWLLQD